jgi:hypothetical protein
MISARRRFFGIIRVWLTAGLSADRDPSGRFRPTAEQAKPGIVGGETGVLSDDA